MARKKRGGKTTVARKTRSSMRSVENVPSEELVMQSPSESEESCSSGTPKSCNTPVETDKPSTSATLVQHKKFGKFRCLLMEDSNKTEISSSESEVQAENLEADSKDAAEVVVQTETIIEHFKTVEISETESSQDIPMCIEEIVQDDASVDMTESILYGSEQSVGEIIGIEVECKTEQPEEQTYNDKEEFLESLQEKYVSEDRKEGKELEQKDGEDSKSNTDDSNSTTVRRSSRIKSISVLKQRSKGHGLVKSDRDKKEKAKVKVVVETDSESNNSEKTEVEKVPLSLDSPSFAVPHIGFENEQKPVKVKSRWRRSSELEMGNSSPLATAALISPQAIAEVAESAYSPQLPATKEQSPVYDEEMENRLKQFQGLTENQYLTERTSCKEARKMVCDCFLTKEETERGEFGCGEDCLNRLLMIECGAQCVVGDRCTNKRFQNTQYAPCEVFRTEKKGYGIRATAEITFGEFIMEYVGEVLDPDEFDKRAKEYSKDKNRHYYFMALRADAVIDATQKGNISRFINHSCDPNAETQKWTVNGELRIGFFSKRTIQLGEEITFDYQFQRYGKEAQKCYCEAPTCRGWIGEEPDEDEDEEEDEEEDGESDKGEGEEEAKGTGAADAVVRRARPRREASKRKHTKKQHKDIFEDLDLDEEMEMLSHTGIKNQAHTLKLSRLMVRAKDAGPRTQLLGLLRQGELPCRRLFLDYHGLRLIHGWMSDAQNSSRQLCIALLQTLAALPIPNKTMLQDSKVLSTVENWSRGRGADLDSPAESEADSPKTDTAHVKEEEPEAPPPTDPPKEEAAPATAEAVSMADADVPPEGVKVEVKEPTDMKQERESEEARDRHEEREQEKVILQLCLKLLLDWANLKEVFRIPKKERIEQMKEHEREADRDYKAGLGLEKDNRERENRYSRKSERYRTVEKERRKAKESERAEHDRSLSKKPIRIEERVIVPVQKLSKHERRQLFALQVAQEEEGRRRKQEQEMWRQHEQKCLMMGTDPRITPAFDVNTGYQCYWNPNTSQWQNVPHTQPYPPGAPYPPALPPNAGFPPKMAPAGYPTPGTAFPGQSFPATQSFGSQQPMYDLNVVMQQPGAMCQGAPPHLPLLLTPVSSVEGGRPPPTGMAPSYHPPLLKDEQPQYLGPIPPPVKLPSKWKCVKDKYGRPYYYHIKIRMSQWEPPEFPPPPEELPPDLLDSSSSTESSSISSDTSSDSDDDTELGDTKLLLEIRKKLKHIETKPVQEKVPIVVAEPLVATDSPIAEIVTEAAVSSAIEVGLKRKRDGLVTEIIISPRREEDIIAHKSDLKKYKETKEKLRRQKELILEQTKKRLKSKMRSGSGLSKLSKRHKSSKPSKIKCIGSTDMNSEEAKKIKELFRTTMASVMVQNLNAYRKSDCKVGRITNTEDFKHLARKLTHFVMLKELKHIKNIQDLTCNESVKVKAKDFVKKYMAKFGEVYLRPKDEVD